MAGALEGRHRGLVALSALALFLVFVGCLAGVGAAVDGDLGRAAIELGFGLGWLWIGLASWRRSPTSTPAVSED